MGAAVSGLGIITRMPCNNKEIMTHPYWSIYLLFLGARQEGLKKKCPPRGVRGGHFYRGGSTTTRRTLLAWGNFAHQYLYRFLRYKLNIVSLSSRKFARITEKKQQEQLQPKQPGTDKSMGQEPQVSVFKWFPANPNIHSVKGMPFRFRSDITACTCSLLQSSI